MCIQACNPNKPLTRALTPGQILQTMVDIGNEHRMSTLTTMSSCDLLACRITPVVHQVASSDTSDSDASFVGDDAPSVATDENDVAINGVETLIMQTPVVVLPVWRHFSLMFCCG
jgi:hypothetical protein